MTSVIVPAFNAEHVLTPCVPAVLALHGVDEWIWVDDGSSDGTAEVLARLLSHEPRARVVAHSCNRGRAAARNTGAAASHGDSLVFLDADVVPSPDLALRFGAALADGAIATVARLIPQEPLSDDPYGEYQRRARRGVPLDVRQGDVLPWRLFVTAACALNSASLAQAGGFDESIRYGEDLELACRLSAQSATGLRASGAVVEISDTSTLEQALANMTAFGSGLPAMERRCPDLLRMAGLEQALGSGWRYTLGKSVPVGRVVRWMSRRVPLRVQPFLVRYLLGHSLLRAYADARPPNRSRR